MNKEYKFNISNSVFNVFSSKSIETLQKEYHIDKYYYLNQIHSTIINIVDNNYLNNTDGDALITNMINTPLVIRTADCIPIVLYDEENKVLAAVHSGWKGTLNNIVKETIKTMKAKYHTNAHNLKAYLYPSIRQCHFEVEIDVYNIFKDRIPNIDKYTKKQEPKYYIDLQQIVIDNLKECGLTKIYDANECTYCKHNEYYSYRYDHTNKRNYLIAYIKESK